MIPFAPRFLTWINPGKDYNNDIKLSVLISAFENKMIEYIYKKKCSNTSETVIYFKIPKAYKNISLMFLENIVYNLEKEGFIHHPAEDDINDEYIARTYSFYTAYLKYYKIRKEYSYESPLYIEYGPLERAIGIKICI